MADIKAVKDFYYNHNLEANNTFYDSMDSIQHVLCEVLTPQKKHEQNELSRMEGFSHLVMMDLLVVTVVRTNLLSDSLNGTMVLNGVRRVNTLLNTFCNSSYAFLIFDCCNKMVYNKIIR